MTQVVIVGAGPTGATLALLLAKRGIAVKLIEASRNFRRVFRGEGLMPSGLDALEQMGLSPMLERIPHRPLDAWEFIINKRSLFRVEEPMELGGKSTMLVSQPALLEALIQEASTYPNFELVQSEPVQDLMWSESRVSGVKLGDNRTISADLVIGADGRNSIVRQRANLTLEQQSQSFNILWFKLSDSPRFESENVFYSIVNGRHAFGLFRGTEGNLQVGWSLYEGSPMDWKQINWAEMFASVSPLWLAEHFQENAESIERPVLLSVVVGRCPRWSVPGLLLLGDAAHPMSPIRAQGINMALRDVIVATNYLVPQLRQGAEYAEIDAILPQIQAEREPEIVRSQQLQSEEAAQAERLTKSPPMQWAVSKLAPLISRPVRQSWLKRQRQLRQGVSQIQLTV
ncbi:MULTISPECIES: FAD-dependent monooxygenase [Nostoc]|uniref:FAD-dependent monooxygenase n=2 Tax=Nostoc TaxID=1177 RepID=A0ABR8IHB2_9NOSO|nr:MULTISPECIES: FAD-dependent monooxygenase [Nostoc]MBD2564330.1 FAD-dependent monooxygenase [Nostoc linckia FACHB-391]MBD2650118.1 FAD-dependent monooxygenase [Nostoc foliaceum FACHB-393]